MISCKSLSKNFQIHIKRPGISGALRAFVTREYRDVSAVKSFDLDIPSGEIVGFLGPNGAGKTTLIKMLTGIIVPSSGSAIVLGYEPFARAVEFRKQIALVMGQKSQLWWDIPAYDSFLLLKSYYEISTSDFNQRLNELTELLNVQHLLQTHVRRLSLGERMKMELIACLLHQPKVIFLDEPTIGLDLVAQTAIRDFITRYHALYGCTVVLTSHYMADVEALCSRIVLILDGAKRFDGSIESFEGLLGNEKYISLTFDKEARDSNPIWEELRAEWNEQGTRVDLRIPETRLPELLGTLLQNYPVSDINTEKLPIEKVMRTLLDKPEMLKS